MGAEDRGKPSTAIVVPASTALAPLVAKVRARLEADPIAERSRRGYASDWRAFEGWCPSVGAAPEPPSAEALLVYLTHLADEGLKLSTIERAQAGIVHTWRARGHKWFVTEDVSRFWENLRRERAAAGERTSKKAALTSDLLIRVVESLPGGLQGARDRALLTLGWTGAFRRSELVALNVEDVAFKPEGMIIAIRQSKTDQRGKGLEVGLPLAADEAFCATRALRAWLDVAEIKTGALFRGVGVYNGLGAGLGAFQRVRAARLTDWSVAFIVKRAAQRAGLDPKTLAGHSLRAGLATSAAEAGRSLPEIKAQTRHASDRIVQGYIRHASLFKNNAAKGLL